MSDRDAAHRLWIMCKRDPLFFINTFGWIYEPRTPKELPFITYEPQDEAILRLDRAAGHFDVGIDKSRDMGGSWVVLSWMFWRWNFYRLQSFLLVSRTEALVDSADDSDALFWKLDFLREYLPPFLRPNLTRSDRAHLKLMHPVTRSMINGASTTSDVARGGRRTAVFMDEYAAFSLNDGYAVLASTQAVTNTRVFLSTPKGAAGAFYEMMHGQGLEIDRIHLHWSRHPLKRRGLYTAEHGILKVLDERYDYPKGYEFVLDGKLRSPWYDKECRRCPIPTLIAQELDIDYVGSASLAFNREILNLAIKRDTRDPVVIGELKYTMDSADPLEFGDRELGRWKLWVHTDAYGSISQSRNYCCGCDISWGTSDMRGRGASNSVASWYDRDTGVKIAQLTVTGVEPKDFAKMVVATCRWMGGKDEVGPHLGWEANGPGRVFGEEVLRLGYRNVYYRKTSDNQGATIGKATEVPGWWSTKDAKISLLTEYQRALQTGECCNRDESSIREAECYVVMPNGSWEHQGGIGTLNPLEAADNHGDKVIADSIAWMLCRKRVDPAKPQVQRDYTNPMCFAARMEQRKRERESVTRY